MDRQSALSRANRFFDRRGWPRITDNILADCLEGKTAVAPPKTGGRNWTRREYRRILEIGRLRSLRITAQSRIRLIFWLKRIDLPIHWDLAENRELLIRINAELRNSLFGQIHSTYPHGNTERSNSWSSKSVLRKMGELDATLIPVVEYSDAERLDLYKFGRWGDFGLSWFKGPVSRISNFLIARLVSRHHLNPEMRRQLDAQLSSSAIECLIGGAFQRPSEGTSPLDYSIRKASPEDFEAARKLLGIVTRLFRRLGLKKVSRSLLHPQWRFGMFITLLHVIFRARKLKAWEGIFSFENMDAVEAFIATKSAT